MEDEEPAPKKSGAFEDDPEPNAQSDGAHHRGGPNGDPYAAYGGPGGMGALNFGGMPPGFPGMVPMKGMKGIVPMKGLPMMKGFPMKGPMMMSGGPPGAGGPMPPGGPPREPGTPGAGADGESMPTSPQHKGMMPMMMKGPPGAPPMLMKGGMPMMVMKGGPPPMMMKGPMMMGDFGGKGPYGMGGGAPGGKGESGKTV